MMASKCLEGIFFPELALQKNRWSFSLMTVLLQMLFIPLLLLFFKKRFKYVFDISSDPKLWRYLWLIPMTFYLFWYHALYMMPVTPLEQALQPVNTIFTLLVNLGALVMYDVIAQAIRRMEDNRRLQADNYQLSLQNMQYESLRDRIEEMRRTRHDLRQHMRVLRSLAEEEKYDQLREYLDRYLETAPAGQQMIYCSHPVLNAVIAYYAQLALEKEIDFSAQVSVSEEVSVEDADLAVLFGNLLENACEACLVLPPEKRFIRLQANQSGRELTFVVDNSFSEIIEQKASRLFSARKKGEGIGLESVRHIVERYGGLLEVQQKDEVFYVTGLLRW